MDEGEVCCICMDELAIDMSKNWTAVCCGKQWHLECDKEVRNSKMPFDLKTRCHHCCKRTARTEKEGLDRIREWVKKGKSWAQRLMATFYRDGSCGVKQSGAMAVLLCEKAIQQGDPHAMCDLGHMYRDGDGVVQSHKKAIKLYTMGIEHGSVSGLTTLAVMHENGHGVQKSIDKAIEFYTRAVERGDPLAMYNLATIFDEGAKGVDQSKEKANQLFSMAAEKGNVNAMFSLGFKYIHGGQCINQSNEMARKWWTKAAAHGNEDAIENLERLDDNEANDRKIKKIKDILATKNQRSLTEEERAYVMGLMDKSPKTTTRSLSAPPLICCSSCSKPQSSERKFPQCKRCHTVQYCNADCQRVHWKTGGHKQECKRLQQEK